MDITSFFVRNRLISVIVILLSLLWGGAAYLKMPRFEDPEFLIRTAQIVTEYPGASPQEVADEINDAIETEIQGMQEVSELRSTAYYGYSIISVDIKHSFAPDKESLQLVWSKLRGKVQDAEMRLPPGAGKPSVDDDYGDVFGLYYLITGSGFSSQELDDYADELRKSLLGIKGIAKVEAIGRQQEAIFVEISRARVAALGTSVNDVYAALSRQNAVTSAGSVRVGDQRLMIHPSGQINSVEAIENVMVSVRGGREFVRLSELANVSRANVEPAISRVFYNGEPAIALGISNVSGSNVAKVGEAVRRLLKDGLETRPNGIEVHEFYHQGDIVNKAVKSFAVNVVVALFIVLITLALFMGIPSALVIGAVLTITIGATLATMQIVSIPMHRISLGALIIALGMLVDNAIVVTEGILAGVRQGVGVLGSATKIVGQTKWALFGGTVVGIIAFAPIGFAPGDTAEYTNHLFWVILISLAYSWIFAITLAPMLADVVFKSSEHRGATAKSKWLSFYQSFLRKALSSYRWFIVTACVSLFAVALWGAAYIEEGFFPTSTIPQIAIDYWLPESTDIDATSRDVAVIESTLLKMDGIQSIHTVVGAGALRYMLIYSPEVPNGAYAQLILKIDGIERIQNLLPEIQRYIDDAFPAAQARVWRFRLGPSQGSKIEAAFQGPDPEVLRALATKAQALFAQEPLAVAVKTDWRDRVPVVEPVYDVNRGGRLGVSREDFANALHRQFSGSIVGTYREEDDLIPIIARSPVAERGDVASIGNIQVPSLTTGGTAPLSETLSDIDVVWRDSQMLREDRIWTLKVQADPVEGVLASTVLGKLRPRIEAIDLPPGYTLRWDGEFGDSETANAELAQTVPFGLLAMIITVVLLFNALRQAAIIWLTVPLSIIGVVLGLLATNTAMEFMAILGVLSLSGLLIKNAIVLVDQMDSEIKEGKPRFDAVVDSAVSRARPVLMGASTTVLGLLPLIGDVFFASMAVVIVFGLSFATFLTLLVVPALYSIFFSIDTAESALNSSGEGV